MNRRASKGARQAALPASAIGEPSFSRPLKALYSRRLFASNPQARIILASTSTGETDSRGTHCRKEHDMASEATRRQILKGSLAAVGLGLIGLPDWAVPALAADETLVGF